MKFSYQWLKELTGIKDSPEKLAELLTLRAFEVESITKTDNDWVLDIKLLPNRVADASGHAGMAAELAALRKLKVKSLKLKIIESKTTRARDILGVKIENADDCPRYSARVMDGVKVGPAPKWIKDRLEACGIQSINNIVDAANFVMLELGQPLHVFDMEKLKIKNQKSKRTIIVRRAREGEKLLALDDKIYPLSPEILVIADEKEPIAIAGIKGGKESGVNAKTKTIVLESANFDPVAIRIGSRLLNLKTDASYRFEHGMDPNQTAPAIDRLAELIQKVAGGEIFGGRVDKYPNQPKPLKILLCLDYASRLIGETISHAFAESSFKRLSWSYVRKGQNYIIQPPTERRDIQIEEDVIEEIVRLWGYEKIRASLPRIEARPIFKSEARQWEEKIKDILVGAGFTEAYAYIFTGEKLLTLFDDSSPGLLEIANPTSLETQFLSDRPIRQYLKIAADNLRHHQAVSLFGVLPGFKPLGKTVGKMPAEEKNYLVIVRAVKEASRRGLKNAAGAEAFYAVKGALDHLFEALGITDEWYDDALTNDERRKTNALHPHRTAKVMVGNEFLGVVAELHPTVTERLKGKGRIVFAELDFEKLWKLARAEAEFKPIGKYPAVIRDIAVIVPENVKADDVEGVIQNAGGGLLVDSDLFDYFQDEAMTEAGQKSLAFHLVFQSDERTLTDEEVNRLFKKIVAAVKQKGWEVRE